MENGVWKGIVMQIIVDTTKFTMILFLVLFVCYTITCPEMISVLIKWFLWSADITAFFLSTCWCLATLPQYQQLFHNNGLVNISVDMMKVFPTHFHLLQSASGFIGMMSFTNPEIQNLVIDLNGIELLINASHLFPNQSYMQASACAAFWNIGANPIFSERIYKTEQGTNFLLSMLKKYENNIEVQRTCIGALWTLSSNTKIIPQIINENGIEILFKAHKQFEFDPMIKFCIMGSFSYLVNSGKENSESVIPLVIEYLDNYPNNDNNNNNNNNGKIGIQILTVTCATIFNIGLIEENKLLMVSLNVVDKLLFAMNEIWRKLLLDSNDGEALYAKNICCQSLKSISNETNICENIIK